MYRALFSLLLSAVMLLAGCADNHGEAAPVTNGDFNNETAALSTAPEISREDNDSTSGEAVADEEPYYPRDPRTAEYLSRMEECEDFGTILDYGAEVGIADLDSDGNPEIIVLMQGSNPLSAVFGIDENGAYLAGISEDSIFPESTSDVSYYGEIPDCCIVDGKPRYFTGYWVGGSGGGGGGWAELTLFDRKIRTEPIAQYEMSRDGFAFVYEYSGFENEEEYERYIADYFAAYEPVSTLKFRIMETPPDERTELVSRKLDEYFTEYNGAAAT